MESWEAIRRAVGKNAGKIAKRIGRSSNLVSRWCLQTETEDFSNSGAYSDLDRLEGLMDESMRLGTADADALAPLHYLARRFDGLFLPFPTKRVKLKDFNKQSCKTMKEVAEALAKVADVMADDKLSPTERRETLQQLYEGLHEMCVLTAMIEGDG